MSKVDKLKDFANAQTPEQVIDLLSDNHLWIDAFKTIDPDDSFKIELANTILHIIDRTKHREYGAKVTYIRIATS